MLYFCFTTLILICVIFFRWSGELYSKTRE